MPGPVVQLSDPWSWVPDWLKPQGASVTDPAWVPPVRFAFNKAADVVHALGLDDPQQQVLGLMGAMTAPGGDASTASAVLDAAAEKFPRLAKVIKAFHASPHDFEAFDISKIGTGEGNQAFGHGLYFAENPAVSGRGGDYDRGFTQAMREKNPIVYAGGQSTPGTLEHRMLMDVMDKGRDNAVQQWERNIAGNRGYAPDQAALQQSILDKVKQIDPASLKAPQAKIYEVGIHADPEHFVDLDKPLSQQSKAVQDAFHWYGIKDPSMSGMDAYNRLGGSEGIVGATRNLYEIPHDYTPIPGLKYLDQQSRLIPDPASVEKTIADLQGYRVKVAATMAEDPDTTTRLLKDVDADIARYQAKLTPEKQRATSNYVVFDDALIEIRRRYGWVLPAAVGAQVEYLRRKANQQGGKIAQSDLDGI